MIAYKKLGQAGKLILTFVLLFSGLIVLPVRSHGINPFRQGPSKNPPVEGDFVDINGNRIHYIKSGHGPPVVLLHGFGAWSFSWRSNIGPLSEHFTVHSIDLLGFGRSDKPKHGPYTVEAQAELVSAFIEEMKLKNVSLVGNSLGGEIAIKVTASNPEKVRSLVLIDSLGYREKKTLLRWVPRSLVKFALEIPFISRWQVEQNLKATYYDDSRISDYIIDGYHFPIRTKGAVDALISMSTQLKIGRNQKLIKRIDTPTLIIWGERDQIIPVTDASKFKNTIEGSELEIIKDSGHAPQEEKPAVVNRLILNFLKNRQATGMRSETHLITSAMRPPHLRAVGPARLRFF